MRAASAGAGHPGLCITRSKGTVAPPSTAEVTTRPALPATPGSLRPAISSDFSLKSWSLGAVVAPPEAWLVGRSERYSGPGVGSSAAPGVRVGAQTAT